jgi:RimJ/RimL family protein N-acetyltransferase
MRVFWSSGVLRDGRASIAVMHPTRLEVLDDRWLADIVGLVGDPDVGRFTRIPEPLPIGFARSWLASYRVGHNARTGEAVVAVSAADQFLGLGLVPDIDHMAGEAELGDIVASAARGRGVATEILRLLTRWAFDDQRLLRVYLIIDVDNHASHRVAQRCGYRREGVMRSIYVKQGQRIDAALWSRLPTDPEPPTAT